MHTLLIESDKIFLISLNVFDDFNPHSLYREGPWYTFFNISPIFISIHTFHTESDAIRSRQSSERWIFQSILSIQRVTWSNEHSDCGGHISIHTLHTESDPQLSYHPFPSSIISIHTLHTESDDYMTIKEAAYRWFQSTLSIQRVTNVLDDAVLRATISIHTLHTESDITISRGSSSSARISIHTLHTESDHFDPAII